MNIKQSLSNAITWMKKHIRCRVTCDKVSDVDVIENSVSYPITFSGEVVSVTPVTYFDVYVGDLLVATMVKDGETITIPSGEDAQPVRLVVRGE